MHPTRLYECISEMKKGSRGGYDAETGEESATQKAHSENPMNSLHYIGFDVHKKAISFCVKTAAGEIVEEGSVLAQREALRQWAAAGRSRGGERWKRPCSAAGSTTP